MDCSTKSKQAGIFRSFLYQTFMLRIQYIVLDYVTEIKVHEITLASPKPQN